MISRKQVRCSRLARLAFLSREAINNEIGCNVFGRLDYIDSLLKQNKPNRDVEVRRELSALLKFFPATKRKG